MASAILITFIITWFFYRISKSGERYSVITSLIEELKIHSEWMEGDYPPNKVPKEWKNSSYLVLKLSTVATDLTIEKAGAVFLNPDLIAELTNYRQKVESFKQLIDSAMNFQADTELWKNKVNTSYKKRIDFLITRIHEKGVGTSTDSDSARATFIRVREKLNIEAKFRWNLFLWFFTGINIYGVYRLFRRLKTNS